jgi:NADPH:quinone reductase
MVPPYQRAIVISAPGGPDVLVEKSEWPVPRALGAHDVLIEVMAAGVNRHDCNQRKTGPAHEPIPSQGSKRPAASSPAERAWRHRGWEGALLR